MKKVITILLLSISVHSFSQGWKQLNLQSFLDFRVTAGANANNRQYRIAHNYTTQGTLEFLRSTTDSTLPTISDVVFYNGTMGIGIAGSVPSALLHLKGGNLTGIRIESTGDAPILSLYTSSGNANNRNFNIASNYSTNGTFEVIQSSSNGAAPSVSRFAIGMNGNIGIGTASPATSSAVEIKSATQGFLPPRMTSAEGNGISSLVFGLLYANRSRQSYRFYDTAQVKWRKFFSGDTTIVTDGMIPIGRTSTGDFAVNTLTPGYGETVINGSGSITVGVDSTKFSTIPLVQKKIDSLGSKASYGSYTPSLTNTTNITSSSTLFVAYTKIGTVAHVSISGNLLPTSTGAVELTLSLPFASTNSTGINIGFGNVGINAGLSYTSGEVILMTSTTVKLRFITTSATTSSYQIAMDYNY